MDTPIYDELARAGLRPFSTEPESEPEPGPSAAAGEEAREVGGGETTGCYWCGMPLWEDSPRLEYQAEDPRTGETVTLTACSPEHAEALRAHRDTD